MKRHPRQWRDCDPESMATKQSQVAIAFAFADAKHDICQLMGLLEESLRLGPVGGDEWADRVRAALEVRS